MVSSVFPHQVSCGATVTSQAAWPRATCASPGPVSASQPWRSEERCVTSPMVAWTLCPTSDGRSASSLLTLPPPLLLQQPALVLSRPSQLEGMELLLERHLPTPRDPTTRPLPRPPALQPRLAVAAVTSIPVVVPAAAEAISRQASITIGKCNNASSKNKCRIHLSGTCCAALNTCVTTETIRICL